MTSNSPLALPSSHRNQPHVDLTPEGQGRQLLPHDRRQELEAVIKEERPLGMILIELTGYTLFQRLYGLAVSSTVTAKLDEAVRVQAESLFGDSGFMYSAQIDGSSNLVLLSREGLDMSFLVDAAVDFRLGLDRKLGTMFGAALYLGRSVNLVMDREPLIADGATPVEQVARLAMARDRFKIYDHVIVTDGGQLVGLVSVQKILDALARVQVEMAKGANPLTGLPGGMALEWEIETRCAQGDPVSFIYIDLDNFKVYNDTYGWNAGDKMIRLLSRILAWAVGREGGPDSFLGHIGGDDFVLITSLDQSETVCRWVTRAFSKMVRVLYRPEDRHRGYVEGKDRNGHANRFPLVSVSLAIVDCAGGCALDEVAKRAAEVKTFAKSQPGNVYVRDRRGPLERPAETSGGPSPKTAPAVDRSPSGPARN